MHELSVCFALMQQVEKLAEQHNAHKVTAIHLTIGPLSGTEAGLLRQAFPVASDGTIAEDAELIIAVPTITVRCQHCGAATIAVTNRLLCGECGTWHTELISGDELILQRLEME